MSKIIQIKRGNGTPPELQYGEPAFDNENKKIYVGSEDGTPIKIGGDDIGKQYTDNQGNVCGEIFNDYERNKAFSIGSHTEGGNNIAGGRGYKILNQFSNGGTEGVYQLRTIEGLEIGMEYSIRTGFSKPKVGEIIQLDDVDNFVWVTNFQTIDLVDETKYPDDPNNFIARNYLMIVGHPELGDMDIGFNAHAEGEENIAHDADTHVEGWNNKALAMFGHAEGRQNIVGYAAHVEGWSNESLGDISHTEGKGNKALALGSHVEGRENKSNENANYSHVEGWLSETKAPHSHAEGYGVITKGEFTHGEGYLTTPIGENSHTEGKRTVSLGDASHAEGGSTTHAETIIYENGKLLSDIDIYNKWTTTKFSLSKGKYSHIEGLHNLAIGENSHAEGEENFVKGKTSHSEGFSNTSEGNYSHVEGGKNIGQSNYSHIEGYNNKISDSSSVGIHIEGYQNTGLGLGAHVEGRQNTVSSGASHAEGRENTVNALYAHGEGYKNTITAQSAHGEGQNNSASGIASHVEGSNNIASAENSHAEGQRTTASGKNSHAQNYYTIASGENQTVIGKHNIEDDSFAFIIGNGTALAKKSNAHTIDWDGNAWFAGNITIGTEKNKLITEVDVIDKINNAVNNILYASSSEIGGMADNAIADSEGNNIVETYVKNIDYATYDKAGILSVGNGLIIENDKIHIDEATEVELEEKCECHRSITPDYIDTAVYYSTHQDMSDDYLVTNLKTSDKFEGTEGELPVSYNAVKNYIDNFSVGVIDNLTSEDINKALSANQGRILNEKLEGTEINVIGLNEVVPDNAITSLCDFTFTPKTQNIGYGLNRITPNNGLKDFMNFDMPIFTSKGSLCVKDKEGNLKYKQDVDSLINHKNVADTLSKDGVIKKWSDKFYFNPSTLNIINTETLNNGANFLHTIEFAEDEFINVGIPKQSDNITFISSCLFMGNTGERVYNGVPDPAKFYYENGKYYLEIRTSLNANIIKSYFSYTKVFICYELQTPYIISNYFAMGLSSGDVITFEEDNSYYTDLIERVQLLYDSDLKKWITPSSGDPTPINTTPTMLVNVPTSFSQAIEGFDQAAKMLNNSKSGGSSVEKNSQWIGEGDGKTDYTKQIQGKIDELNILKGGEVYLGKGIYKISSSLVLYNNISLVGEGDQTIIEMTSDDTHAIIVNGSHLSVRDLTIKLTGNCSKYTSCIYINSNNKNQALRPEMPDNIYCQYNTFTNLNLKGTYGFDWEGNYVKISDKYENYFGCGIMCESLFFNYANIDNVKITGMCHGMHGVGGSNKISIYCENSKIMVYDDAGGGYCDITIFGHTYYGNGTDENHSIVSMSDVVGYFKTLEQSVIREYVYDVQWMKHIFIFEGMTMNNRYLVSQIAGVSYFANNEILDETKRRTTSFVKDLGRGNRNIEEFKKVPYHIGNYYDGYTKGLTSYKENDPIIHNVLSGVGKWGNITSNTTFTGLPLNNICRYPKDGYTNLASAISTVAPSETNPIEIEIDVSNRPFTCQPNFFIQFDGRYVASDFSVSFDTTNNGEYDKTYTIQDNNDIVYSFYNHQYILFTMYRIKFSFTKAFSFSNFKYQTSNYEKFETPYNENNLIGIVNFGMISNEYVGRAFLGECGGTIYGEIDMNSNSLKNIANPTEDGDAVNKKYIDNAIGDIEIALENIIEKYKLGGETS